MTEKKMNEEITRSIEQEFVEVLSKESSVSLDYLVSHTSASDRCQAKRVLRHLMRNGMITTTPGFKYKLSNE